MSETQAKYLETFPNWLRTLGSDAEALGAALALPEVVAVAGAAEAIAGGLNYLFKSLDLIPDGIDDIGYLDDAFVLRIAADIAVNAPGELPVETDKALSALAADCDLLRDFLGDDYKRLESYVKGLRRGAARGRSVADILGNEAVRAEFVSDVRGFASSYESPSFTKDEKNLIKLKAFFDAKLPKA